MAVDNKMEGICTVCSEKDPGMSMASCSLRFDIIRWLGLRTVPYTVTAVLLGSVYGYGPYITDRILRFEMLYTVRYGRNTAVYGNTDV